MAFVYFRDVNTSALATSSQAANLRSLHWGEINTISVLASACLHALGQPRGLYTEPDSCFQALQLEQFNAVLSYAYEESPGLSELLLVS